MTLKDRGKRGLAVAFRTLQRAGVDVLPRHFYSSIPDVRHLRETRRWRAPRSFVGVAGAEIPDQLDFLRSLVTPEVSERLARGGVHENACRRNGAPGYGPVEADVLYAFTHSKRPRRVIQVGAGVSTAVMLEAAADARHPIQITAIDPYPTDFLDAAGIDLTAEEAQDVPVEKLADLDEGDLLFIDSTHTVKPDSEVNLLVLEVLPRLRQGVWVHFHDVTFPYDYQRDILEPPLFFWSESTLVHAFLIGNERFRIAASLSMLHYGAPAELGRFFPYYRPEPSDDGLTVGRSDLDFPSSLYLRTT